MNLMRLLILYFIFATKYGSRSIRYDHDILNGYTLVR